MDAATQARELQLKCRVLSCLRQKVAEQNRLHQRRSRLEAAVCLKLRRWCWRAWLALLKRRARIQWAIHVLEGAAAAYKKAVSVEAFNALRAEATMAEFCNEW